MKKILVLVSLVIAVLGLGLLTSCSDDDDTTAPVVTGVTFKVVDGTNSYSNIKVKGAFNEWVPVAMNQDGNVWTVTIDVPDTLAAGTYEWGAIEDDGSEWGIWLIDGPNPTVDINENGFGSAEYDIPEPQGTVNVTLNVDMNAVDPISADGVHVAGSFQNWDPAGTEMTDDDGDGIYSVTVEMEMNSTIQFKFLNGNAWGDGIQEVVPEDCGVDDQNGGFNRQETVPTTDASFTYVFSGEPVEGK